MDEDETLAVESGSLLGAAADPLLGELGPPRAMPITSEAIIEQAFDIVKGEGRSLAALPCSVRRGDLPRGPVPIRTGTVELLPDPHSSYGVTVLVNGVESSYLDLAEPAWLEFEYMQQMVAVLDAVAPGRPLTAIHLGGAGCALPRALDARRPGSRQVAVEIDADLAALVRTWFDLPRAPRLRVRVADGRAVVEAVRPSSQDTVVRDAFAGDSVPGHLRTVQFTSAVGRALRPTGVYLANNADYPPLRSSRREAATLSQVFPHTALVTDPAIAKGRRFGNVVLLGSHAPLPLAPLARDLRVLAQPAMLIAGDDLARFRGDARPFVDPNPRAPDGHDASEGSSRS